MRLGMFDPKEQVPFTQITPDIIEQNAHQELAKEAALQSLVLLKNENNFSSLVQRFNFYCRNWSQCQ